nr:hypothetical protein [Oscillospiraceae bacterium]
DSTPPVRVRVADACDGTRILGTAQAESRPADSARPAQSSVPNACDGTRILGTAKAEPLRLAADELLMFATKTCPNCRQADKLLTEAGIPYRKLLVEEHGDEARRLGVRQVPTLVRGDRILGVGVAAVRRFINEQQAPVSDACDGTRVLGTAKAEPRPAQTSVPDACDGTRILGTAKAEPRPVQMPVPDACDGTRILGTAKAEPRPAQSSVPDACDGTRILGTAKAEPLRVAADELLMFATKTCPNCRQADKLLTEAGIPYRKLLVEEHGDEARRLGVRQAPTLVRGDRILGVGVAAVRRFIQEEKQKQG